MAQYRIPSDYQNQVSKSVHSWPSGSDGTIHPGLAYPIHHRHLNIGDRVRGSFNELIQSEAMQGPLVNGFKLVTIATFTPDSVIYGWLRNGKRYSPAEYQDFTRWSFCPIDLVDGSEFPCLLKPGLFGGEEVGTFTTAKAYENWVNDSSVEIGGRVWNSHVGRGSLWDWLGLPAGSVPPVVGPKTFPGPTGALYGIPPSWNLKIEPAIAYFLSFYYYLANMQDDNMYYTRSAWHIAYQNDPFENLTSVPFDLLFNSLDPNVILDFISFLSYTSKDGVSSSELQTYYYNIVKSGDDAFEVFLTWLSNALGAHGGLFAVPYSPDFFNNIINLGESPTATIPVETTDDGSVVAVPDLRFQTKIQNMLDRLFVSGGRVGDVFRTLWGTKSNPYVNKPDFLGVWQTGINPQNVVASAVGSNGSDSSSVGQMAARVDRFADFSKGQHIDYYAKEAGTLMFISFLVPVPSYSQGLHPDLFSDGFAGDFNPEMKGLGFTSVPRWRYSMMPNSFDYESNPFVILPGSSLAVVDPNMAAVGDTVYWDWLRTDYRRVHGELAQNGNLSYWVLVRPFTQVYSYGSDGTDPVYSAQDDFHTYVNPLAWQYLFVGQSLLDPNFVLVSNFDLKVVSSVPSTYMPFLGR